jgi:Pyruvate/2-oxoacid:ferredoxin oxidoreductase delta subunit
MNMQNDVYTKLREFLDRLPGGYPETPTGVEIRILKKLFRPEDAELALQLKAVPETVSEIAKRVGRPEAELAKKLEDMSQRGLIFRVRDGDKKKYQAVQFIVGIYEFQLKTIDREFCEMVEEYMPYLGMSFMPLETKQLRVAPVEAAIDGLPEVATYNRIRELVKKQKLIAMSPCICRKEQGIMGKPCERPKELCFSFGQFAQYVLDNDAGRQISTEEAMKLLDLAEESALVLEPSNTQELSWICCCCGCCCGGLRRMRMLENPADYVRSYYYAKVDAELCTACGTCLERCQMAAIKENSEAMEVDIARCIGCGLCVPTCPAEAISLVEKPGAITPPKDFDDMLARLSKERGLS